MKKEKGLSLRMQQVADFVIPCRTAADVGCDHGYVSIYLLQHGIAERVIAMDVRRGPLSRAEQNRDAAKLQESMECRLSDGLDRLNPGEADVIIIAGMGGPLMIDILERGRKKGALAKQLVLQPQSDIPAVRRYLHKTGYAIVREAFLKEEGKYYTVFQAEIVPAAWTKQSGEEVAPAAWTKQSEEEASQEINVQLEKEPWTYVEYQYGKYLLEHRNPVLFTYLEQEMQQLSQIHASLTAQKERQATMKVELRLQEIEKQLRFNQEAQNYYIV